MYEAALQAHPSSAMYDAAVDFAMQRLFTLRQEESSTTRKLVALLLQWTNTVCSDGQQRGMFWSDWLASLLGDHSLTNLQPMSANVAEQLVFG